MKHILFELEGCPFSTLDDEEHIKFCLLHASEVSHSQVLKIETHKFEPQGVTGFALLAESHLSIHTWLKKVLQFVTFLLVGMVANQNWQ